MTETRSLRTTLRRIMPLQKPLALALAAMLALAGCNLQPHYVRPAAAVPASWPANPAAPAGTPAGDATAAQLHWQQVFSDPRLRQIITLALNNNRDLQVAALDVEKARAQYGVQHSALLPSVTLNAADTAEHLPGGLFETQQTGAATYHEYDANLGVMSYELDFFGRVRSLRDEALESFLASAQNRRAVQISLVSQVASAYLTLCSDNDLLQLAQDTRGSETQSYQLVKMQYDADVANAQDLAQAEIALRAAEADVASYTRARALDIDALNLLVGAAVPAELLHDAHLSAELSIPQVASGMSSNVLLQRPDVLAAEHALKAANADIGAARADFFPSISLTASGGSSSGSLGKLFNAGTGAWSFMPSLSLPIFNGGRLRAQLAISKVSQQIDVANYQKTIQTAFREVADALAATQTFQVELAAQQRDAAATDTNARLATLRYQQGVDDYLNVLVAQRLQYQAGQNVIKARLGLLNQRATLYKALGGGYAANEGPSLALGQR